VSIVVLCLLVTSLVVYYRPKAVGSHKQESLREALSSFGPWKVAGSPELRKEAIDRLQVDDHLFARYTDGASEVMVYIGYYLTSRKVGAAHDPLVCFPGQGWTLADMERMKLRVTNSEPTEVRVCRMVAEKGNERELILYWYQAYDDTATGVLEQKLRLLWQGITSRREDNAFVRTSMRMGDRSVEEASEEVIGFIRDFYPAFVEFVKE
jgi:EpsI family protein